jgi:hypothetical protein
MELIEANKTNEVFMVDQLLKEHAHEVACLPSYTCEFNVVEILVRTT